MWPTDQLNKNRVNFKMCNFKNCHDIWHSITSNRRTNKRNHGNTDLFYSTIQAVWWETGTNLCESDLRLTEAQSPITTRQLLFYHSMQASHLRPLLKISRAGSWWNQSSHRDRCGPACWSRSWSACTSAAVPSARGQPPSASGLCSCCWWGPRSPSWLPSPCVCQWPVWSMDFGRYTVR